MNSNNIFYQPSTPSYQVQSPVAFFIYNRPNLTQKIFNEVAKAQPKRLFVIADGPKHSDYDRKLCEETRAVTENITWECEVTRFYSSTNLGCRSRISSGLNQLFDTVEEAIILEDDIFPHESFFRFCDEMLTRYKDNPQIMMVAGCNVFQTTHPHYSYFFSRYPSIWGWATWKRAWKRYDVNICEWPRRKKSKALHSYFTNAIEVKIFSSLWNDIYYEKFDTWDYQWDYCRFFSKGIGIIPSENLITNLGFGAHATHTKDRNNFLASLPLSALNFPLFHPQRVEIYKDYDEIYFRRLLYRPPWRIQLSKIKKKVKNVYKQAISAFN
ncbi:MAG: glycosyltransferase family 2 protein [Oligoflexia bacterium]|nr:glycosyltransferase family 2 protein [Oligoflexia bacterium]